MTRLSAAANPDAYFILNLRPAEAWAASRARHSRGTHALRMSLALDVPVSKLPEADQRLINAHREEAQAYFRPLDAQFLEFDIASDAPEKLAGFLSPDYSLDPAALRRRNRARPEPAAHRGLGRKPEV